MNVENLEALLLIPNGFPVWIDVAPATFGSGPSSDQQPRKVHGISR